MGILEVLVGVALLFAEFEDGIIVVMAHLAGDRAYNNIIAFNGIKSR